MLCVGGRACRTWAGARGLCPRPLAHRGSSVTLEVRSPLSAHPQNMTRDGNPVGPSHHHAGDRFIPTSSVSLPFSRARMSTPRGRAHPLAQRCVPAPGSRAQVGAE